MPLKYVLVAKNKSTQNVRRILLSQKTFANHLADEEAESASQNQNRSHDSEAASQGGSQIVPPRLAKTPSQKRGATQLTPAAVAPADNGVRVALDHANRDTKVIEDAEPLLRTYVPSAPSDEVMAALLAGPPLSYNGARAGPSVGKPQRRFCEICGYWGTIKCIKCGARVCGLECKKTHSDGRCIFYS